MRSRRPAARARARAAFRWMAMRTARSLGTVVGLLVAATALAFAVPVLFIRGVREEALPELVSVLSLVVAWSAGILTAYSIASRAYAADGNDGVLALLRYRGASPLTWLGSRVGALALLLTVTLALASSAMGVLALIVAPDVGARRDVLFATGVSWVYAALFSLVLAPLAFAATSFVPRARGYLTFLALLLLPELVAHFLRRHTGSWSDVVSVPGALDAARLGLLRGDGLRALRGILAAAVMAAAALAWAATRIEKAAEAAS